MVLLMEPSEVSFGCFFQTIEEISTEVWVADGSVRFTASQGVQRRRKTWVVQRLRERMRPQQLGAPVVMFSALKKISSETRPPKVMQIRSII